MSLGSFFERGVLKGVCGRGMVLVGVHAAARGMDDEDAAVAGFGQERFMRGAISPTRRTALRQWCRSHISQTMIAVFLRPMRPAE